MNNYELEFERINRKLDTLYGMVRNLTMFIETERDDRLVKEAEKDLEYKRLDLDGKKDLARNRLEFWEYQDKDYNKINRDFNEMLRKSTER